jgi:hypothetical protein
VDKALAARKLQLALNMYEMGETFVRQRLRRQRPDADPEDIEAEVRAWRTSRPGAPHGDAVGRPSRRFE